MGIHNRQFELIEPSAPKKSQTPEGVTRGLGRIVSRPIVRPDLGVDPVDTNALDRMTQLRPKARPLNRIV